ncbi:hypothetical protein HY065_02035 [Candidatus Berkelbacteria bacterium]|nr:hypothetical protein [Candidatus Berkelbacteria bacterium]
MKKIVALAAATSLVFSAVAYAATPVNIHLGDIANQLPAGFTSLPNIVGKIFGTTIAAALVLFLVMLLFGGINYLAGSGNEEATKKAKGRLVDATIGLIITLSSWAIGTFILHAIGYSGSTTTTPRPAPGASQAAAANRLETGARIIPPAALGTNQVQLETYQQIFNELQTASNKTLSPQQQTALTTAVASGNTNTIAKTIDTIGKKIGVSQQKIKTIKQTAGAILTSAGGGRAKPPQQNGGSTQQDAILIDQLQSVDNALQDAYDLGAEDGQRCLFKNPYKPDTLLHDYYNQGYNATFTTSCQKDENGTPATAEPLNFEDEIMDAEQINTNAVEDTTFDPVSEEATAADQGKTDGQRCFEAYAGGLPCDSSNPFYANAYQSEASAAAYNDAFQTANQPPPSGIETNTNEPSTNAPSAGDTGSSGEDE